MKAQGHTPVSTAQSIMNPFSKASCLLSKPRPQAAAGFGLANCTERNSQRSPRGPAADCRAGADRAQRTPAAGSRPRGEAHLGEGQVQNGLGGQGLQVVLSGQSQGLQEEGERRGEARGLPVQLGRRQHHPTGEADAESRGVRN